MIKLIVGLGNPGRQYEKTRHNVGFLFLDTLLADYGGSWQLEGKFQGHLAECAIAYHKVLLLKPETFMNRSGQAVGKVARYYKIQPEEILVVHDELDFEAGVVKLKKGGGHAGHNGLRDIIAHLGGNDFYRLRIGIGRPAAGKVVADYVLSEPSKADWLLLEGGFGVAKPYIGPIVSGQTEAAMNKLNT
ncbi:MAG: aminoacyl-tRNA hydrolase [Methylovulum miyakonense]|uniref:aminoacyl-tRNA hydrolase n=1 Tax=Methylovulum miyakonense TaxID=645578 RepID=UPI003BB69FCD